MKVFFVLKHYLPAQVAGTEIYTHALAKALQKSGVDVAVVLPAYSKIKDQLPAYDDVPLLYFTETSSTSRSLQIGITYPSGIVSFKELIERERPAILHFQEFSGSNGITVGHALAVKHLHVAIVTTFHLIRYVCKTSTLKYLNRFTCNGLIIPLKCAACTLQFNGVPASIAKPVALVSKVLAGNKPLMPASTKKQKLANVYKAIVHHKHQLKDIADVCDSIISLNNWFYNMLLLNGVNKSKLVCIKQGLPSADDIRPLAAKNSGLVNLVYVGRVCEIKGLLILLKALAHIQCSSPVNLDIYGQETEEEYLVACKLVDTGHVTVNWKGILPPTNVATVLSNYQVFVFPTLVQEMAPLITLEALHAGVTIIASNNLANTELANNYSGVHLFNMGNVDDLANVISNTIKNAELLVNNKHADIPGFADVALQHLQLYKQIAKAN